MLVASCHCQSVKILLPHKPEHLTSCNCSICRRYGALYGYYLQGDVKLEASDNALAHYIWGDRQLEFFHCVHCGCLTHYESIEKGKDFRFAINARMMAPEEISDIPVRKFDGAKTWKFIDE